MNNLSPVELSILQEELEPEETLQWYGKSNAHKTLKDGFKFYILIIPFVCIVAIPTGLDFYRRPPEMNYMSFLFFAIISIALLRLLCAPFIMFFDTKNTLLAITDKRAIYLEKGIRKKVQNILPEDIGDITTEQKPDGSGNILFSNRKMRNQRRSGTVRIGFHNVLDVSAAEYYIKALKIIANQQVDPIVTTPVDKVEAQSTQGHP